MYLLTATIGGPWAPNARDSRSGPGGGHLERQRFLLQYLEVGGPSGRSCYYDSMPGANSLPTKRWLNLAAIKTLATAAEVEAKRLDVDVTICIVDESGNLIFLQKADEAGLNTIQFAQKKARYAALYRRPSRIAAEQLGGGNLQVLAFPDGFPNQGGLPIQVDGHTIGAIAASGAASDIDEAIAQAAINALLST
jgi:glc operon protein GlcG